MSVPSYASSVSIEKTWQKPKSTWKVNLKDRIHASSGSLNTRRHWQERWRHVLMLTFL